MCPPDLTRPTLHLLRCTLANCPIFPLFFFHRPRYVSSDSFWTSSSLDVPAGVTQEEGHTGFLIHLFSAVRALIFLARRIQPFLSLVDRQVKFLCTNDLIVLHPLAFLFLFFSFLVRKIPFVGIELTSQRVRGLRGTSELPGRPASIYSQLFPLTGGCSEGLDALRVFFKHKLQFL